MLAFEVKEIEKSLLTGLLRFSEGLIDPNELTRITDELTEVWFKHQVEQASFQEVKEAFIYWLEKQMNIIKKPRRRSLSERQRKFIEAFSTCGNSAEAARQAGYSPRSSRQSASRLLKKPQIKEAIGKE